MLTLGEIEAATGGRLREPSAAGIRCGRIAIDTRGDVAGALYVPLRGANHDGHAFLPAAALAGAAAALCEPGREAPTGLPMVEVPDTLAALAAIARAWRHRLDPLVVGVTGSSGKTSTKEALAAHLAAWGPVHRTLGNQNNEIGVPLTLLGLRPDHRFAIVEMGMRGPGEIAALAATAEPKIGVVTNVGTAHLGRLGTVAAIAQAKGELAAALPEDGALVFPLMDPWCAGMPTAATRWRWSLEPRPDAEIWAEPPRLEPDGQRFLARWRLPSAGSTEVFLPHFGAHQRGNALAAIAVGLALGLLPPDRLDFPPLAVGGRAAERLAGEVLLVDETYNANPESMRAALLAFCERPIAGRRFALLGEMGELGEAEAEAHAALGAFASPLPLEALLAVGPLAAGYGGEPFATGEAAVGSLLRRLRPGDAVLLKASRAARFERLLGFLAERLDQAPRPS